MSLNSRRKLEFQQLYEQLYRKSLATNGNNATRCFVCIVVSGCHSDLPLVAVRMMKRLIVQGVLAALCLR